eukprot:4824230-Prymnesium_polylepis.1
MLRWREDGCVGPRQRLSDARRALRCRSQASAPVRLHLRFVLARAMCASGPGAATRDCLVSPGC